MMRSDGEAPEQGRYTRRLSDKILAAFNHACEDGDVITAAELLQVLETVQIAEAERSERREAAITPLVEANARLWRLRAQIGIPDRAGIAEPADTPEPAPIRARAAS